MRALYTFSVALLAVAPAQAGGNADPILTKFILDEVEQRSDHQQVQSAQGWLGNDLNKLWLKADHEAHDGSTEEAELQLLYSRAIAPFWEFQSGLRRSFSDADTEDNLVLGIQGLAPYHLP